MAGTVLYRQAGVNYPVEEWEEEAVWGQLFFVTDTSDQVVEVVVDMVDDNGEYVGSRIPDTGDQLLILLQANDPKEPDTINLFAYTDYKQLNGQLSIEKTHYLPNVDFTDSDLVGNSGELLNTSELQLELLLDAAKFDSQGEAEFAFNTPEDLGYTWGEARQTLNTDSTTTESSGGGTYDWIIMLFAALGAYRYFTRRTFLGMSKE